MLRWKKVCSLLVVLLCVTALAGGCFGRPETVNIGGDASGNGKTDKTAKPESTPADPCTALVEGAKRLISTDVTALLTGGAETDSPLGMLSDLIDGMNNGTHRADISLSLTDMVSDGEASGQELTVGLSTAYDIVSGDASLEISLGAGDEDAKLAGVYLTGDTALLKSASAARKIILYEMAEGEYAGLPFIDRIAGVLGGILTEEEDTPSLSDNQTDREELAARLLDPWMSDTQPEEYSESNRTVTLLGSAVQCRVVTLSMTGQRAYDFALDFMTKLEEDEQFADMNGMLGGGMGMLSGDILSVTSGDDAQTDETAAAEIVAQLNALTAQEIEAAVFTVSVIYYGEEVVGIEIEASTTGKAFILNLLAYEEGREHEIRVDYQYIDGSSASLELSKINTGGDAYTVAGRISIVNENGVETCDGRFDGAVTENDTDYALDGNYALTIRVEDAGVTEQSALNGDVSLALSHPQGGGYAGDGHVTARIEAPDTSVSMTLNIAADIQFPGSVTITPPMYTESNVTRVSDVEGFYEALGMDWETMSQQDVMSRVMSMLIVILIAS